MKSPISWLTAALLWSSCREELTTSNPLRLQAHHITASVIDIDRAIKWYQDVLGFTLIERGTRQNGNFKFAELKIPGFGVALVQTGSPAAPPAGRVVAPPDWVHIVFTVPIPMPLQNAQAAAQTCSCVQASTSPIREFLMHDSEGNEIEIFPATRGPTDSRE
jgi:catechol 2,3-dioxygenase-like lactoylglutathione lyase family enzyme